MADRQCLAKSPKGYYCCLPDGHGGEEHLAYIDFDHTPASLVDRWPVQGAL